jgi:ArsR family transcriptional regulator
MPTFAASAQLLKTLGHPARLAIVEALRAGEACVCHLETVLHRRQAYLSQQLMILREAGIVTMRREGLNIYYQLIDPQAIAVVEAVLPTPRPAAKNKRVAQCPCPHCASE